MYSKNKKFDFLYFISPLIIFIAYCLVGVIVNRNTFNGDTKSWYHIAASIFIPAFLFWDF